MKTSFCSFSLKFRQAILRQKCILAGIFFSPKGSHYQRARAKVEKYRDGYAAHGLRHAFLPAIVSTSGRIHGELLRLLFNLADKKTSNSLAALGEAIDVESEVYCRRRSGNFWRMRAALGLACAQAATLGTQVVGRPRSRPRYAARTRH